MSNAKPEKIHDRQKKPPVDALAPDANDALDSIREILVGDAQRRAESDAQARDDQLHARLDALERSVNAQAERLQDERAAEQAARAEERRAVERELDAQRVAHEARFAELQRSIESLAATTPDRGALAGLLVRLADELGTASGRPAGASADPADDGRPVASRSRRTAD